ncbi:putative oxidoreductase [Mesorhizobium soli]|uniref:DoxX family protein n=1 Tax=Pseudaminobacter soli (ex Li et al. 2025) TaxID=1295366 RepID=UPI002474CADD|nr:DoxX family protein [Mesorhizobium soli]MDH6233027.1 putative oxidoreductase [Mesorhizobium soli]
MIPFIHNAGMVLLGGVFVWAGAEHFLKFREVVKQLVARQFPAAAVLLAAGSAVEVTAGLCLAADVARPYAALALIVFTIAASLMALNFWRYSGPERQGLRSAFTINIAVVGGLIIAASTSF